MLYGVRVPVRHEEGKRKSPYDSTERTTRATGHKGLQGIQQRETPDKGRGRMRRSETQGGREHNNRHLPVTRQEGERRL